MNSNRYCVILAGGIGSRLWPSSRENKPKQFLDVLGTGETLLQATYRRYAKLVDRENIIVMSNEQYKDLIIEQLPDVPQNNILLEPMRRNTVPSVVWAAIHMTRINPDSVMLVTPADQLITDEDALRCDVEKGFEYTESHQRLLTLGISTTRPETAFGYIQMANERESDIYQVKSFTEKPEAEFARMFVDSNEFLWNTGLFMWGASTFINAIKEISNEVTDILKQVEVMLSVGDDVPKLIERAFSICPNVPLETGVLEKVDNVDVMRCHFGWSDLGTWTQLYGALQKSDADNVFLDDNGLCSNVFSYNSSDCLVKLPKGKCAVIQELHGYVVVDTDDMLMICKKDDQQTIRKIVNDVTMSRQ